MHLRQDLVSRIAFCFSLVALSSGAAAQQGASSPWSPPAGSGAITAVRQSEPAASSRTLFLIQDIHAQETAQRNIARILEDLVRRESLRLVLLEGGQGNVGQDYVRGWASPETVDEIANSYLGAGLINGAEYLDMTIESDLILWGVEDMALYRDNLEAFDAAGPARETASGALEAMRAQVDAVIERLGGQALRELLRDSRDFEAGALGFDEWMARLEEQAGSLGVALGAYPEIARYGRMADLRQSFTEESLADQQRAAAAFIASDAPALQPRLAAATEALRTGGGAGEFYSVLLETRGIGYTGELAALEAYRDYLAEENALRVELLLKESDDLYRELRMGHADSEPLKRALAVEEALALAERLLALQWNPTDYARYQQATVWGAAAWSAELQSLASSLGIAAASIASPAAVDQALQKAVDFYDAALARNAALIERTLAKMASEETDVAALVVGGFHSDALVGALAASGVRVVVVTPYTGGEADPARYAKLMDLKRGFSADGLLKVMDWLRESEEAGLSDGSSELRQ